MNSNKGYNTRILVEGAVMVALATVLSFIRVFQLPWGGSVTLLSMLPIFIFSIRRGVRSGLVVSFVYALIQFFQGIMDGLFSWGLTPAMLIGSILLDYILAFFVLGIAGIFRKKGKVGWIAGIILASVLRFVSHFLSGVVIWGSFGKLWDGFYTKNIWIYSFLYNGCYMLPEMVFCVVGAIILFSAPQARKIIFDEEYIRGH